MVIPPLAALGYRFSHSLRVRFSDIDSLGMVFHGNYILYLDHGITEYLRMLGFPWREMGQYGLTLALVRSLQEFRAPAALDDLLHVGVRCVRLGHTSFTVRFTIWGQDAVSGDGQVLLEAEQVYVNYSVETRRARPLPDVVRRAIQAFEGEVALSAAAP